jgi:UDP-N-acetylglucosamine 2-epimerase (non-hydrolysing)
MKILTIVGTRPEIIRLSVIIQKLDQLVDHIVIYTNQNYDYNLSARFFTNLNLRNPNYYFQKEAKSVGDFLGNAFVEFEQIIRKETPDKILVLGDTNSGLLSIIAAKYRIPVYHMEAGNRCYDDRLPEEANRRIIDSISKYNLPYTENSKQNLLSEGYHKNYVFKTGNPIFEVIMKYTDKINESDILNELGVEDKNFILVTMHRTENVDNKEIIQQLVTAINTIGLKHKIVLSLHPRTKQKMKEFGLNFIGEQIIVKEGFSFTDFIQLEKHAKCVITDSGTVPEECCIFQTPVLTIRDSTERQELIECGSNILVGTQAETIIETLNITMQRKRFWSIPDDYIIPSVSDTVINILTGKT